MSNTLLAALAFFLGGGLMVSLAPEHEPVAVEAAVPASKIEFFNK